jgi:hypothetical protein
MGQMSQDYKLMCGIVFAMLISLWLGSTVTYAWVHAQCVVYGKYERDSYLYVKPLAIECKTKETK